MISEARARFLWPALIAVSAALTATLITSRKLKEAEQPLPRLGGVPAFILYDQTGEPFPSSKLQGSVWLADFFFTRCQGLCPVLTERMRELQEKLPQSAPWHLVSVTVDPAHDPPGALEQYAREHGARGERWTFLTGEESPIRALITEGFRLAVESDSTRIAEPIVHSQSIVLVDQEGEIRGYYDALDDKVMKALVRDVKRLLDT
ncbi:MAG TPA: SCO family protein [Candidatus Eisenbacteria bacterium]|nr:SCO family protein [Candidatus Eisenbacteria bacterium]